MTSERARPLSLLVLRPTVFAQRQSWLGPLEDEAGPMTVRDEIRSGLVIGVAGNAGQGCGEQRLVVAALAVDERELQRCGGRDAPGPVPRASFTRPCLAVELGGSRQRGGAWRV